ncbi:MAG TPA: hypothetical protein VGD37_16455 [Kofleriaceae bacterium]
MSVASCVRPAPFAAAPAAIANAVVLAASIAAIITSGTACGGGGGTPRDAGPDTPIDTGMCGAGTFFTGEIVDWDSTEAKFCGVFNSSLTVRGQTAPADMSNPNGRFELCVAHQALAAVDVLHGTNQSQCTTPRDVYPVPAVLVAEQAVIDAGGRFSARVMTQHRQDEMFGLIGTGYSAAKAQLVVHVDGPQRQVTIAAAHDTTQKFDGTTWAAGDTGADVFFPNVTPGMTQVTVAGRSVGATTLTLQAGVYTYLTVLAN